MKSSDYEDLLTDRGDKLDDIDQIKRIARLKDIARNLESLGSLADAETKARELKAAVVDPTVTTEEDLQTRDVRA
jgi:hypothetical protein